MRRTFASFVGLLLVLTPSGAAAEEVEHVTETRASRSAYAGWWEVEGRTGTYYSFHVIESIAESPRRPHRYRSWFRVTSCHVPKGPAYLIECNRREKHYRATVLSFEMDPLLMSARAAIEVKGQQGEVTWTSYGDSGPPAGVGGRRKAYLPDYAGVFVEAWVSSARRARASGEILGFHLNQGDTDDGAMFQSAYADQWVCVATTKCPDYI